MSMLRGPAWRRNSSTRTKFCDSVQVESWCRRVLGSMGEQGLALATVLCAHDCGCPTRIFLCTRKLFNHKTLNTNIAHTSLDHMSPRASWLTQTPPTAAGQLQPGSSAARRFALRGGCSWRQVPDSEDLKPPDAREAAASRALDGVQESSGLRAFRFWL